MFEQATRMKLRFNVNGLISVEDLWDLSLERLDTLAKQLRKSVQQAEEESFIESSTSTVNKELVLKFDIVKHIIKVKLEERQKSRDAAERKLHKQKLLAILEEKQDADLRSKSIEDIMKEIEALS